MKKQIKDVISAEFKGLWGTDFSDDGIPVIKTNNMTYEGRIDYSDICLRNITSEEAEGNFLCNGDLIIEKSGGTKTHSVGYVNIFEGEDNKYVCNNFILPIRPNRDLVNPKYLFWQLHGMYEAGRFSDCFNKTTGIQNLQKKTYFSKEINVPSLPEQQKIAAHLDSIQSAIDNKKQQ
ncbi:MAG: restriction endonuclease subunit S, partial [Lachnospiraceae bacterium]|nr:restriction endonuclease subunit S [Lachnospiraceae bacterium]